MSLSKAERFKVSAADVVAPPPPLVQRRLAKLGSSRDVTRERIVEVCETESAANQFIDQARKRGWLVPIAWGKYRVPTRDVLDAMSHVAHPLYAQFAAWASLVREHAERRVAFAAPLIWRETELNVASPLPVVLLDAADTEAKGTPPQWDAFQMDAREPESWKLDLPGAKAIPFLGLAEDDVVLLLRASRDPRFVQAARGLEAKRGMRSVLHAGLPRIESPREAPRGGRSESIGTGPPYRRRLLAPPWYMESIRQSLDPVYGDVGGG